jgi:hypothetical protein
VTKRLLRVFDLVFGCRHRKLSRPFTLSGWTYEVCLECGKQFPYLGAGFAGNFPEQKEEHGGLEDTVLPEKGYAGLPSFHDEELISKTQW